MILYQGGFFILISISNLKKYYGERLVLDIKDFKIYKEDKIAIIGLNGAGKTTLLNIIAGKDKDYQGKIERKGSIAYIEQLGKAKFDADYLSGGEKTWNKINDALNSKPHLLIADEPSSNLSFNKSIELIKRFKNIDSALIIVSHEKQLLNEIVNKIIEVEDGKIKIYSGNYDFYKQAKEDERDKQMLEYEKNRKEQAHLEKAVKEARRKASTVKTRKGMDTSEARLHKGAMAQKKGKIAKGAKVLENRLGRTKDKDIRKPKGLEQASIELSETLKIYAKNLIEVDGLEKSFADKVIFANTSFVIKNPSKTAIIGENASGKTTLVNMIIKGDKSIRKSKNLKIAYYAQDISIVDDDLTVIENMKKSSFMADIDIRNMLARMLFFGDDVFKKAEVLSGGEKVRLAFAKIFSQDANLIILDEPSNYLDINTQETLIGLINDYQGSIILISHNKELIDNFDNILILEDKKIITFEGSYQEYLKSKEKPDISVNLENEILLLENRISQIIMQISVSSIDEKEDLSKEFRQLTKELKKFKTQIQVD